MTKKARNYNEDAFKVGGSPQPADQVDTDREKQKVTREKASEHQRDRDGRP